MFDLAWINNSELDDDKFYNRTEEIQTIKTLLSLTATGNAPALLVTGIRSVGKTVFLNKIKKDLKDEYIVIYMDFSRSTCYQSENMSPIGLLQYYYDEIINECKQKNMQTITKSVKKFFKTNDFHIKDLKSIEYIPIPLFGAEENFEKLKDYVFNLPQEIYEEYKEEYKGIIIIIDEIQVIRHLGDYMDSFLWILRSFTQEHKNVAYVFCGSMSLQDELLTKIASNQGVFGNRMLTIQLDPFTKPTARKYLEEKASDLLFTKDSFDLFYNCTGGIPAYINVFATLLPKNVELTRKLLVKYFDDNLKTIIPQLINIWTRLSDKEKRIIIKLLDKALTRKTLADKLGVSSGSLSLSLNKLQNLDLIEKKDNSYEIKEKLLARWLKKEYEKYGSYPFIVI